MRPATLLSLLLLACALPAAAAIPPTRARALLLDADTPGLLRSRLLAYADSASGTDATGAAEALGYAGTSYQREGRVDSAIVCHRRAHDLLRDEPSLLALVDQLLLRRAAGDASEAIRLLDAARSASEVAAPPALVGRLAWAHFLQGKADTAARLFASVEGSLRSSYEWSYRMGRVAAERGEHRRTVELLLPIAIRSRGNDDAVIDLIKKASSETGVEEIVKDAMFRTVAASSQPAADLATALGGSLVLLHASDGFPLGGMLVPAKGSTRGPAPRLAVVLLAPGDSVLSGDSLAFALRRHGVTTLLLYPRGHGASVDPSCPSPDAWFDRQDALQMRVARDVADAARRLRALTRVDTTRYLVAGVGASATMAVQAAALDPRAKALLLVSPAPAPVDRGPLRALLGRLRLPVFFQSAPDDFDPFCPIAEILYRAGDASTSRVADARRGGSGIAQFRHDPSLAARFLAWLDVTLPPAKAPARRPTRPAARPRG